MRECRKYGSVRGASGNGRPYRDRAVLVSEVEPAGGSRFSEPRPALRRDGDHDMTQEQKIIRVKAGLLELAKQLGNSPPPRRRGSTKPAR